MSIVPLLLICTSVKQDWRRCCDCNAAELLPASEQCPLLALPHRLLSNCSTSQVSPLLLAARQMERDAGKAQWPLGSESTIGTYSAAKCTGTSVQQLGTCFITFILHLCFRKAFSWASKELVEEWLVWTYHAAMLPDWAVMLWIAESRHYHPWRDKQVRSCSFASED